MTSNENDISTLNGLVATTIDSIEGYQESADAVENPQYRELFQELGRDRQQALPLLQAEVARLGGDPEDDGTALASVHRSWVELKSAITGRDDKGVIDEVERGEDHIKHKFEAALNDGDLSPSALATVQKAYESVRRGHDRVRDLKHALEGKA